MRSPTPSKATVSLDVPTTWKRAPGSTVTVASPIPSCIAKSVTGTAISSPGPTTRGSVARIESGCRTNTDSDAEP